MLPSAPTVTGCVPGSADRSTATSAASSVQPSTDVRPSVVTSAVSAAPPVSSGNLVSTTKGLRSAGSNGAEPRETTGRGRPPLEILAGAPDRIVRLVMFRRSVQASSYSPKCHSSAAQRHDHHGVKPASKIACGDLKVEDCSPNRISSEAAMPPLPAPAPNGGAIVAQRSSRPSSSSRC